VRIKLDENLPRRLKEDLSVLGHDIHTIPDEGLTGVEDGRVWEACQSEERFFVTQDLDFSDTRRFAPGHHAGILLIRLEEPGRGALRRFVRELALTHDVEGWKRCFVVATRHKLRIVKPQSTDSTD
jgi:predicted nuclease of predicted toxin-antitoxin system